MVNPIQIKNIFLLTEMKKIGIEKLPYSYSALKKFIDSKTMNIHYNKHYKGYVKKLNDALSSKDYGDIELENLIKKISKYNTTIRNNAGGAFNHALFWNMLSPTKQDIPNPILTKIKKEFGSIKEFKQIFEKIATKRFGSGWVWLVLTPRKSLKIMSTPNQDNPLMDVVKNGGFPLLGLDLWEHSYYLKYQNKRDEYIKNFWDAVNWDFVNKLYELKTKTNLIESKHSEIVSKVIHKLVGKNEQTKKVTLESFDSFKMNNGQLIIENSSLSPTKDSDFFIFVKENRIMVFDKKPYVKDGDIVFPIDSLLYDIQ